MLTPQDRVLLWLPLGREKHVLDVVWVYCLLLLAFVCYKGGGFQVWETGKGSVENKSYEVRCICTWRLEHWPPKRKMFYLTLYSRIDQNLSETWRRKKSDIYLDSFLTVSFRSHHLWSWTLEQILTSFSGLEIENSWVIAMRFTNNTFFFKMFANVSNSRNTL